MRFPQLACLTLPQVVPTLACVKEPLPPTDAKRLLVAIITDGVLIFSSHARDEMAKDGLDDQDALNVLRAGVVEPGEMENGTWRYRVRTSRMLLRRGVSQRG